MNIDIKKQKNPYRHLNTAQQIADYLGMSRQNVNDTYFNPKKTEKHKMGDVLDIGVFIRRHDISVEEVVFMVDILISHKEFIKSKI